jgi:YidC/Oxa1 family membrane protein insertase
VGEIGYLFNIIFTYPIFNGLVLLYHLFGDMGLSIIVLTLVIRLILFPLTLQQLKSMKATQALQPQMAEIRKKYAKDQQAQAVAMQALYKEYGVNPVAGCLPLLVQLPVLYGLFYALNNVFRLPATLVTAQQ